MKNPRITAKERGLIKSAIRRVFSRSDLRKQAVEENRVNYSDPNRPRVKKWSICHQCDTFTPTYLIEIDHRDPIIPINSSLEEMSWDQLINRIWCDPDNLNTLCKKCHKEKSKTENKARRAYKKEKK